MIQYNLTSTRLFTQEHPRLPTDGELLAVLVALMAIGDSSFKELRFRALRLDRNRVAAIATWIQKNLPVIVSEFQSHGLRERLNELVGLEINMLAENPRG